MCFTLILLKLALNTSGKCCYYNLAMLGLLSTLVPSQEMQVVGLGRIAYHWHWCCAIPGPLTIRPMSFKVIYGYKMWTRHAWLKSVSKRVRCWFPHQISWFLVRQQEVFAFMFLPTTECTGRYPARPAEGHIRLCFGVLQAIHPRCPCWWCSLPTNQEPSVVHGTGHWNSPILYWPPLIRLATH